MSESKGGPLTPPKRNPAGKGGARSETLDHSLTACEPSKYSLTESVASLVHGTAGEICGFINEYPTAVHAFEPVTEPSQSFPRLAHG
jgi:hypothetical protein